LGQHVGGFEVRKVDVFAVIIVIAVIIVSPLYPGIWSEEDGHIPDSLQVRARGEGSGQLKPKHTHTSAHYQTDNEHPSKHPP
jgi:hypothetical protein